MRETNHANVAVLYTDSYNKHGIFHYLFKVSQVDFLNKCVLQSLNIAFIIL